MASPSSGRSAPTPRHPVRQLFIAIRAATVLTAMNSSPRWRPGRRGGDGRPPWAAANPVPLPLLVVDDTRIGLGPGRLGGALRTAADRRDRQQRQDHGQGMCAAILRAQARIDGFDPGLAVLATKGNLNNDIGLPLMLLRLSGNHRAAVIEMGMNHPGEIGYPTHLARPTVALRTTPSAPTCKGMAASTKWPARRARSTTVCPSDGVAVINADDAFAVGYWRRSTPGAAS